ncbi:hypothetical protein H5410_057937 [Solanum commersonii]|uniref:DUF4371 domain-containing protein n=1 Tax=Solanum commersonii TaxID=4109 RepID=A0A9J5WPA3_SOLCO|nr:hypothetical protein H5410_057937 [Solanum commersonii]
MRLENAPQNDTLTCPMIQKDIVNACGKETLKAIIGDLNGNYFGILVDESKDISHKEQMALNGEVVGRFIGLVHVSDTSACSLKKMIYSLLFNHSLSPSKLRGQCYDGASNMNNVLNVLGGSFKRTNLFRHHQAKKLEQLFESGEVHKGQGIHQEHGLQRPVILVGITFQKFR